MSYISFLLMITTESTSSRDTVEVFVRIKNLKLRLNNHSFDENDPIKFFDLLTSVITNANIANMLDPQKVIAIPTLHCDPAEA